MKKTKPDYSDYSAPVNNMLKSGFAKLVPTDDRYAVTKDGDGYSRAQHGCGLNRYRNKWIKLTRIPPSKNYLYPRYTIGRGNSVGIHVLVAQAFLGPRPHDMEVRHLDGDYLNPRLKNLAYGSRKDNSEDAKRHGTRIKGERQGGAIWTRWEVAVMRDMRRSGYKNVEIARKFNTSHKKISAITCANSKTWLWMHEQNT